MFLVDSHCHLHLLNQTNDEVEKIIERAKEAGVRAILNVCVSLKEAPAMLSLIANQKQVYASIGLHPNATDEEVTEESLRQWAAHEKVIAIGETGLDYYRNASHHSNYLWQKERFRKHIKVAKQLKLPLIIHTRAAKEDTIQIMHEENAKEVGGVMHCFTEDWQMAEKAMFMNFYISFSGVITFKNAHAIQEVARKVPLDRILIETDAPYLTPHPLRGKPNEPAYVKYTAQFLAELKGVSLSQLALQTTQNFYDLFKGANSNV